MHKWRSWLLHGLLVPGAAALVVLETVAAQAAAAPPAGEWTVAGQNLDNTHSAPAEHVIGPGNVSRLTQAWQATTGGDVSATPTEGGGAVYFPDFGGELWAVKAPTGQPVWSHRISDYTGVAGDLSRVSPAIYNGELVLADGAQTTNTTAGAYVFAVDAKTGRQLWRTKVDDHPAANITSSPVVYGNVVYIGVSSKEEAFATNPSYPCCTFRGSVVALDATTGRVLWKTYTVPDNGGRTDAYSGGAVWGSTFAVNPGHGLLYAGVGNNYTVPSGVCTSPGQTGCSPLASDDYVDAIIALDMKTGAVRWAARTVAGDLFTLACGIPPRPNCGPDFDFGTGPNLYTLPSGRQLVGAGQKSGIYWAVDALTGAVVWQTPVGPGSVLGGILWGAATDGHRIYVAIGNLYGQSYTITAADGRRSTTSGGSWAALDPGTGRIIWQVADPQGAMDLGFMSVANGVVYAPSDAVGGDNMYALDARDGRILWRFASGGAVVSGAAIVNGVVYWGSGYRLASACPGAPATTSVCAGDNQRVYAFRLAS